MTAVYWRLRPFELRTFSWTTVLLLTVCGAGWGGGGSHQWRVVRCPHHQGHSSHPGGDTGRRGRGWGEQSFTTKVYLHFTVFIHKIKLISTKGCRLYGGRGPLNQFCGTVTIFMVPIPTLTSYLLTWDTWCMVSRTPGRGVVDTYVLCFGLPVASFGAGSDTVSRR